MGICLHEPEMLVQNFAKGKSHQAVIKGVIFCLYMYMYTGVYLYGYVHIYI